MRPQLLCLTALLLLAACGGGGEDSNPETPNEPPPTLSSFALGIEYMELGLADAYAGTGVTWAKTRLESFEWGEIEPAAPAAGVHAYDWSCTDAMVGEYQAAGFLNILSYVSSKCAWGNVGPADIMPAPVFMADYRAFISALVERYDGDGVDDMPGLRAPIREWVVGPEWTGFWPSGDADDYILLLEATNEAAHASDPDVRLATIPFLLLDVFTGNEPSEAEIAARLTQNTYTGRNDVAGIYKILDRPELFDTVSVHSLGDYTEIPQTLRWFRQQMQVRGYQRPVHFDDAFPMSLLANGPWPIEYPLQGEADRQPMLDVFNAVADRIEPAYSVNKAWVEAEVAAGTVKKFASALGEGAAGIQIGNTEDWMHDTNPVARRIQIGLIGAAAMMGAIEVTHPGDLYDTCSPRAAGARRPAWYALRQCARFLGNGSYERVERLTLPSGGRGYVVHTVSSWWAVVWREDDVLQLPGTPEPTVDLDVPLPIQTGTVDVETTVTAGTTATTNVGTVNSGTVRLPLRSVPVFVSPR